MMINLKEISKIYRTDSIETKALNNITLEIKQGDFLAIMGPSGCGKSTLMNIIGLIDSPSSGSYTYKNKPVENLSERKRGHLRKGEIGFVFQSFNLIDELTVFENVELPLLYLQISKKERKERVEHVLAQLNIMHRKSHFPTELSGGQQQRVAIARALVAKPSIILADEPTGNLDSKNGAEVMNILKSLNEAGITIVMVTHSEHDASFAKSKIEMFDGSILTDYSLNN